MLHVRQGKGGTVRYAEEHLELDAALRREGLLIESIVPVMENVPYFTASSRPKVIRVSCISMGAMVIY